VWYPATAGTALRGGTEARLVQDGPYPGPGPHTQAHQHEPARGETALPSTAGVTSLL